MSERKSFQFQVDGRPFEAHAGQTIAEALLASGIRGMRRTRHEASRGVFCGMGVCYECRMIVDGTPNVRTCMTAATPGCRVETQRDGEIEQPRDGND